MILKTAWAINQFNRLISVIREEIENIKNLDYINSLTLISRQHEPKDAISKTQNKNLQNIPSAHLFAHKITHKLFWLT